MNVKQLSHLEQQVMKILWKKKVCSIRDIVDSFAPRKKMAYTTIATIMQRLNDKNCVVRKEGDKGYFYSPKFSEEAYSKTIAKSFLTTFIHSFGNVAIASFADSIEKLPKEKKEYFLRLIEQYDKTK